MQRYVQYGLLTTLFWYVKNASISQEANKRIYLPTPAKYSATDCAPLATATLNGLILSSAA